VTVELHPPASLVDQIRRDIVDGAYNPRERLVEAEVAERYGVTRSAMRVALLELTAEGLVEREPNRGARIRALTLAEGIEIVEVRREVECLCARLAAERGTDEERRRLLEIAAEMRDAFSAPDVPRYLALNTKLHTAIHAMARHELARRILTQLGNLNLNRHFPLAFTAPVPQASIAEHTRIAEAIARGDAGEAAAAMRHHLDSLLQVLRAQAASRTGR
jgi:DNA-binding GntR family transcriptional regulator